MKLIMTSIFSFIISFSFFVQAAGEWKIVPHQEVCMVTNVFFGKTQIPVEYSGKTYYGCCEGCKATLMSDAKSRTAIDPVTKKSVDKATAVIAAKQSGEVLYFENKASFKKYR